MMKRKKMLVTVGFFMLAFATAAGAEELKFFGAASVVDRLISPHKAAVEKKTDTTIKAVTSNAGKGLIDLVDGKCDASLASAPLETVLKAAKAAGRDVDASRLKMTVVASDEIVFIVHPTNPVSRLTWEQLRDIHTGKITNWKEVGGRDAPIVVYTDDPASATRGLIKQVVMGGLEYSRDAKPLDAITKVNDMVASTQDGIGGLGKGFVKPAQVKIIETKKIERPLGFITIGEPAGTLKRVIEAFREEASKK